MSPPPTDPNFFVNFWNQASYYIGPELWVSLVGLLAIIGFVTINALALIYGELKIAGHIQRRPAMMEVGWHGFLQPVMDAVKLLVKELTTPTGANRFLFIIAPGVVFLP
jgi:NADH-quinone oxidoreductase subunit H